MTPKQQRFVEEYLIDLNATQAAIRAGYSAKTANEQGARLLANVSVRNAVSEAKAKRSKETGIDAAWVLSRLAAEAFADLADLYDEQGRVKPVKDWPLVWRQGLVAGIEVETIGEGAGQVTKIKISERIKRVELIGKHVDVQAFKEKLEVAASMTLVIDPKDAAL
jgi:phage terminase small subunit